MLQSHNQGLEARLDTYFKWQGSSSFLNNEHRIPWHCKAKKKSLAERKIEYLSNCVQGQLKIGIKTWPESCQFLFYFSLFFFIITFWTSKIKTKVHILKVHLTANFFFAKINILVIWQTSVEKFLIWINPQFSMPWWNLENSSKTLALVSRLLCMKKTPLLYPSMKHFILESTSPHSIPGKNVLNLQIFYFNFNLETILKHF